MKPCRMQGVIQENNTAVDFSLFRYTSDEQPTAFGAEDGGKSLPISLGNYWHGIIDFGLKAVRPEQSNGKKTF